MEQKLLEIFESPHRMRETYVKKHHPSLYDSIISYVDFDISFKEKLWYYYNKLEEKITCKCGKETTFNKNFKDGYKKYCSAKCAQTAESTKEKRKKTTLHKYGVDNVAKSQKIKDKTEETNIERYGHRSTFQNKEVQSKWKENIKNKYGVDHIFQSEEVKGKIQDTMKERYGGHYTKTDHYTDKLGEIGFKELIRKKKLDKHKDFFKTHGYEFIEIKDYRKFTIKKDDDIFEIYWETFINRLENGYEISTNINPLYYTGQSEKEKELISWIRTLGVEIDESNRKILNGKEIDIFLPEYKLGIEFNGLYWHSEMNKEKKHHINKTKQLNELGISLVHVWEDDWDHKKNIIQSIILNKLNKISNKIYARKCIIKEVNSKETNSFLDKNHIQGKSKANIKLGLYYRDELVSLMTFGYRNINGTKQYELIRFCNKINNIVVGSASKLFKYFINNYNYDNILSYSDISMFDGKLYEMLGFENMGETSLNYWWVVDKKRYHRFTYNKKKLIKEGHDPNLTEKEIMYSLGNYRIWGCGQIRWVYKKRY